MSVADPQPVAPKPRFRWLPLTPVRFLLFLLVVYGFLALSKWFHWFPEGYAEWTAVGIAGVALIVIPLLFIARLLVKVALRYRLRALLVVMLACSITGSWWAVSAHRVKMRRLAIEAIHGLGGYIDFDDCVNEFPSRQGQRLVAHTISLIHRFATDSDLRFVGELTEIKALWLDDTDITDTGLRRLEELTQLAHLSLRDCNISDAGLEHLKGLTVLRIVNLSGTKVTDEGMSALRKALPDANISRDYTFWGASRSLTKWPVDDGKP